MYLAAAGVGRLVLVDDEALSDKRADLIRKYGMWCRISMDAACSGTHKIIHRTANNDFERRIKNIKKLTDDKPDTLTVGISFIITPDNYMEISAASRLFADLGVDHLRFSWMYDKEGNAGLTDKQKKIIKNEIAYNQEIYNNEKFNIFTESDRIDLYSRANTDFKKCYYQRFVMAIGADCKIYPCCIQKYHKGYEYADIREKSLKDIVFDINTVNFMDNLDVTRCNPCWLRNRNKSIGASIEQPKHHNFI